MQTHRFFTAVIAVFLLFFASSVLAQRNQHYRANGTLHIKGFLSQGGCVVASTRPEMRINMGNTAPHYSATSDSTKNKGTPFTLQLTECRAVLAEGIGIKFSGREDPNDHDLFSVMTGDGNSDASQYSGLGLFIASDEANSHAPANQPVIFQQGDMSHDAELHYLARYQKTSRNIRPGLLRSEVWFDISYP